MSAAPTPGRLIWNTIVTIGRSWHVRSPGGITWLGWLVIALAMFALMKGAR